MISYFDFERFNLSTDYRWTSVGLNGARDMGGNDRGKRDRGGEIRGRWNGVQIWGQKM